MLLLTDKTARVVQAFEYSTHSLSLVESFSIDAHALREKAPGKIGDRSEEKSYAVDTA